MRFLHPVGRLVKRLSHRFFVCILLATLSSAALAQAPHKLADFGHRNMEASGTRPLLIILLEDPKVVPLAHDAKYYEKLFFGSDAQTVNNYFNAMSGGKFKWSKAGILGPYKAVVTDGSAYRPRAVQVAASNGFDFSKLGIDKDGNLTREKLVICVIINGTDGGQTDGSSKVPITGTKVTVRSPIAGVGDTASFGTICHELMHTLGSLDLYGPDLSYNKRLTLSGQTGFGRPDIKETYYLDAWHRMQFGWVDPVIHDIKKTVGGESMALTQQQLVEGPLGKAPSPLLLFDSDRGTKEFFLLEHRRSDPKEKFHFDKDVASNGVAIWHVQHGDNKMPFLTASEASATANVYTLNNRGAPDFKQGGTTLYKPGDPEINFRWMDKKDAKLTLKVTAATFPKPGKEVVNLSWHGPRRTGAAIIQSSFGNLEVVAQEGSELWHWFFVPGKTWARGSVITSKATGPAGITQNKNGNFEVVAIEGKDLVHYWAVPGKAYNRGAVISTKATGPGSIIYSSVGNLEAVVLEGNELHHYYFAKGKWAHGALITNKASSPGTIAQNKNGNFEVVVQEGKDLVHYWVVPGKPYNRGAVITTKANGPGSIVQGSTGNMEVIVPEGEGLVHYWFDKAWKRGSIIGHVDRVGISAICRNHKNNNLEAVLIEGNHIVHYWEITGKGWNRGAQY